MQSHPSWVRGLKFKDTWERGKAAHVAPLVGAWIEMQGLAVEGRQPQVAPLVGAWIEIKLSNNVF